MSFSDPFLHNVEASTTRGTTALVYCLINSSLYTGTVHRWWSTSNWPDGHQGCSQISTIACLIFLTGSSQEAKYVEHWPNTASARAGWSRFDISVDRYGRVRSQLICTSRTLGSPTCHWASQQGNTYWAKYQKAYRASTLCTLWGLPFYIYADCCYVQSGVFCVHSALNTQLTTVQSPQRS